MTLCSHCFKDCVLPNCEFRLSSSLDYVISAKYISKCFAYFLVSFIVYIFREEDEFSQSASSPPSNISNSGGSCNGSCFHGSESANIGKEFPSDVAAPILHFRPHALINWSVLHSDHYIFEGY